MRSETNNTKRLQAIDLNSNGQAELVRSLEKYYREMPFDKELPGLRYPFVNDFFLPTSTASSFIL